MDFENDILKKTLIEEGGWADDPDDAGGKTQMGITQATLGVYLGRPASDDEIHDLSRDMAIDVYKKLFYEGPKIHLLPEVLQSPVFDWGVNAGPARAIMGLQQLVDDADVVPDINIDGGIGPFTLKAVAATLEALGPKTMVNAYQDQRQAFYDAIVARKPSQAKFIVGWTARCNRFRIL
jgi:lysozyme family protein